MMSGKLEGLTFVFTGNLDHFVMHKFAKDLVRDLGGKTASSVSKKTDYLVAGRRPESKLMQNAQSLGIPVLTEEEFIAMTYCTVRLYMKVKKESDWAELRKTANSKIYGIPFTAEELFHGDDGMPTERQVSFRTYVTWDAVCDLVEKLCTDRSFSVAYRTDDGKGCCTLREWLAGCNWELNILMRFQLPHPDDTPPANIQSIFEKAKVDLSEAQKVYLAGFDGENFAFAREGMTEVNGVLIQDDTVMRYTENVTGRVMLPDGIRRIREEAFKNCSSLEEITLPPSLTEIGGSAFENCTALKEITLPPSVEKIGWYAFSGCTALEEITLPPSVTEIGGYAFIGCTSLEKIELPASVTKIGWSAFENCTSLKEITLPPSVTKIGKRAFSGCTALKEITLPSSVKEIGASAFSSCHSLAGITLPESVETIGGSAFSGCTTLREITLPASVKEIGRDAFSGCTSLTEIHLPAEAALSKGIFQGCDALEGICLVGEFNTQKAGNGEPVLWGRYKSDAGEHKTVEIPKTVRSIEAPDVPYTAFPSGLQNLALIGFIEAYMRKKSVREEIKEDYFDAIRHRRNYAVYLDRPLIIRFLTQEKYITQGQIDPLLEAAAKMDDVELIAILMDYKHSAFSGKEIQKEELRKQRKSEKELERILEPEKFVKPERPVDTSFPSYVRKLFGIKKQAENYVASRYHGTESVAEYPAEVGGNMICGIGASRGNYTGGPRKVILPEGYQFIGDRAFCGCKTLEEIVLPASLKSVGAYAFSGCRSLKQITIPEGCQIGTHVFEGCPSLKKIILPESCQGIEDFTFKDCSSLKEVILPTGCGSIGERAFYGCSRLKKLSLGKEASFCSIDIYAFAYSGIRELYVYSSKVYYHPLAFHCMDKNYVIYAPKGSALEKRKHGKPLEDRLAELAAQGLTPEDDF